MTQKQEAKLEQLSSYHLIWQENENRLNRLDELERAEQQADTASRDRRRQERLTYLHQIAPQLARNRQRMQALEEAVSALEQPLWREVLRLRYFDGGFCRLLPWRQVALRLYGDDDPAALQFIRRLHLQALDQLDLSPDRAFSAESIHAAG